MARESKKTAESRMAQIAAQLEERYPQAECALEYGGEAWKLLVMGRLSAQCTDARVNIVCKELFRVFPTPESLAQGDIEQIEQIVKPCGLYRTKAANIKSECADLCYKYGGVLPDSMDELLKLDGVGRKIANLLLGDIYKRPAVVADTHCIRICGRLGFYPETLKDPYRVEKILSEIIAPEKQSDFCHRIVWFGREVCTARSPKCESCPISSLCKHKTSNK